MEKLAKAVMEGYGEKVLDAFPNEEADEEIRKELTELLAKIHSVHSAVSRDSVTELQNFFTDKDLVLAKDKNGNTPLHKSVLLQKTKVLEFLIEQFPETINAKNKNGLTALHYAAAVSKKDGHHLYKMLLQAGADRKIRDNHGRTPDYYKTHLITLLNKGTTRSRTQTSRHLESLNRLSKQSIFERMTAALQQGDTELIQELVLEGQGKYLLTKTSWNEDVRKYLKELPSYLSVIHSFHESIKADDADRVKEMISSDTKLLRARNPIGALPIHLAAAAGSTKVLQNFIQDHPHIINSKDNMGRTALHIASMQGNQELCDILKEAGLDTTITDQKGKTAEFYFLNAKERENHTENDSSKSSRNSVSESIQHKVNKKQFSRKRSKRLVRDSTVKGKNGDGLNILKSSTKTPNFGISKHKSTGANPAQESDTGDCLDEEKKADLEEGENDVKTNEEEDGDMENEINFVETENDLSNDEVQNGNTESEDGILEENDTNIMDHSEDDVVEDFVKESETQINENLDADDDGQNETVSNDETAILGLESENDLLQNDETVINEENAATEDSNDVELRESTINDTNDENFVDRKSPDVNDEMTNNDSQNDEISQDQISNKSLNDLVSNKNELSTDEESKGDKLANGDVLHDAEFTDDEVLNKDELGNDEDQNEDIKISEGIANNEEEKKEELINNEETIEELTNNENENEEITKGEDTNEEMIAGDETNEEIITENEVVNEEDAKDDDAKEDLNEAKEEDAKEEDTKEDVKEEDAKEEDTKEGDTIDEDKNEELITEENTNKEDTKDENANEEIITEENASAEKNEDVMDEKAETSEEILLKLKETEEQNSEAKDDETQDGANDNNLNNNAELENDKNDPSFEGESSLNKNDELMEKDENSVENKTLEELPNENDQENSEIEKDTNNVPVNGEINQKVESKSDHWNGKNNIIGEKSHQIKDHLDELIEHWIEEGDLLRLEHVVLAGQGDRLIERTSEDKQVQDFLDLVPIYMAKIRGVHEAVVKGLLREVRSVLTRKRFALSRDHVGASPLHLAILHGHTDVSTYIISHFPETMDGPDNEGRTPLHYATALRDNGTLYKFLKAAGADENIEDKSGHSAKYYMSHPGELSLEQLLAPYSVTE